MSFEPIVECRHCGDPLEVYQDYEHRFCECCDELRNTSEICCDCRKTKTGLDGEWFETKYGDKLQCFECQNREEALHAKGDAMADLADAQSLKAASYVMDTINGRNGNPDGRTALKEILQAAKDRGAF
jgi:hypothetical protein